MSSGDPSVMDIAGRLGIEDPNKSECPTVSAEAPKPPAVFLPCGMPAPSVGSWRIFRSSETSATVRVRVRVSGASEVSEDTGGTGGIAVTMVMMVMMGTTEPRGRLGAQGPLGPLGPLDRLLGPLDRPGPPGPQDQLLEPLGPSELREPRVPRVLQEPRVPRDRPPGPPEPRGQLARLAQRDPQTVR